MKNTEKKYPSCFSVLEVVFPEGEDGLRKSPESCLMCVRKTECLRAAMRKTGGLKVREEFVDRAYESGVIGFFERWSKKKRIHRKRTEPESGVLK